MRKRHWEHHRTDRIGWLRAAVLGANDGIVSTASLILGVAAAHAEHRELALIYERRGLDKALAKEVSKQLMAYDALGAHARDELGITDTQSARPIQAALASAASFAVGAVLPLLVAIVAPVSSLIWTVSATSLVFLASLGAVAARTGGAPIGPSTVRVTFWGALAMAVTAGVGALFGVAA